MLTPGRQLPWFKTWWKKYPKGIASVEEGTKDPFEKYGQTLSHEVFEVESEPEDHDRRKLSESVINQRALYRAMGIISADEQHGNTFAAGLVVEEPAVISIRLNSRKQKKNETELDRWNDFRPAEEVLNLL